VHFIHEIYERMIVDFRHYFVHFCEVEVKDENHPSLAKSLQPWKEYGMDHTGSAVCTIEDIEFFYPGPNIKYATYS